MAWQQSEQGECLKRFETLSFVDSLLLLQPTGAMSNISKGQGRKKKKSSIVQPLGGRVKHQCEKKKITVLSTNFYEEINLL